MFTQRHTAYKVLIKDLLNNKFVHREGESDYVTINKKQVSRIRVMATIVNKYLNDEKKSGTLVIDDGSEVISVRGWEDEFHLIDNASIGDLVDITGRVRIYNNEVYLTPEIIKEVTPDWFVLRKLELSKRGNKVSSSKKKEEIDELSDDVLQLIKDKGDEGALMDEVTKLTGSKKKSKKVLKSLLENDLIFEPKAGKYKIIN